MAKHLLILLFSIFFISNSANALQMAEIEYIVPIDYKLLNEQDINTYAEQYYKDYLNTKDTKALQNMLTTYTLLSNIDETNPLYLTRVGIAYDKMKTDRLAKSYFYRSMCVAGQNPYVYSAFGDFWFDRTRYRKALHNYLTSNDYGYDTNFNNLEKLGMCYEKLGDYKSAIKYYKMAIQINQGDTEEVKKKNEELTNKIQMLEALLLENPNYDNTEKGQKKE